MSTLGLHTSFSLFQTFPCFSFQVKPHRASLYAWFSILSFYMLLHIRQRKETLVAKQEKQGKWKHWAVRNLTLLQECRKRTGRELCYFSVFAQTNVFAITLCKQCINWYALVVKKIPHGLQADHLIWKLHKRSTKEERIEIDNWQVVWEEMEKKEERVEDREDDQRERGIDVRPQPKQNACWA